jgi:hypothetical protein
MDVKKAPDFAAVDRQLRKLGDHFDLGNATGSRPNAIALGQELAKIAIESPETFKVADKRLTAIVASLIGDSMGAVAGAVEHAFHSGVSDAAKSDDILRANKAAKKERGI